MKRSLLITWLIIANFFCGNLFAQTSAPEATPPSTASLIAAAAAGGNAPASEQSTAVTLLNLVKSGGWAMIPLGAMSVLAVMLIIVYAITMRRGTVVSKHFMDTAETLLRKRDYPGLLAIANRHSEAVARVTQRTLDFAAKNPTASFEVLREIAQTEGASQAASLQHRTTYLADIAVLSPMVGLLGTVMGMIHSFGVLASNASQASRPVLLAQGVSEALVATGAGLIVGVIAMAFYGLFRNKAQGLISDLERASTLILGLMAMHYEKHPERKEEHRELPRGEIGSPERDSNAPRPGQTRRSTVSIDDEF